MKKNRVYYHLAYNQHKVIFLNFCIWYPRYGFVHLFEYGTNKIFTFAMRMCDLRAKNSNLILTEKTKYYVQHENFQIKLDIPALKIY